MKRVDQVAEKVSNNQQNAGGQTEEPKKPSPSRTTLEEEFLNGQQVVFDEKEDEEDVFYIGPEEFEKEIRGFNDLEVPSMPVSRPHPIEVKSLKTNNRQQE